MTDQEIIDAIKAEIDEADSILAEYRADGCEPPMLVGYQKGYIQGLIFARELIERRTKEVTF